MTQGEAVRKQLHVDGLRSESTPWEAVHSREHSCGESLRRSSSAQCGASGYRDGAFAQRFAVVQFIALNPPPPFFKLFERSSYTNTKKES